MQDSTHEEGEGEGFWPGYVDAVTNLAISLLMLFAVMALVVMASFVHIAQTPIDVIEKLKAENEQLKKDLAYYKQIAEEYEKEIQKLRAELQQLRAAHEKLKAEHEELLKILQRRLQIADTSKIISVRRTPEGILVTFPQEVRPIAPSEAETIIKNMATVAPLPSTKWRVSVVYPKGLPDADKLAATRANAISELLRKNGVPDASIDVRVVPSEQVTANVMRVAVNAVR